MQLFFSLMFTYPSFPQPLSWPTGAVDLQAWKNVMITLEKDNDSFAVDTYKLLVPEPAGPQVCQLTPGMHAHTDTLTEIQFSVLLEPTGSDIEQAFHDILCFPQVAAQCSSPIIDSVCFLYSYR